MSEIDNGGGLPPRPSTHKAGPWTLGEPDKGFVPVNSPEHGALATVVWQMEEDAMLGRGSPRCEANARLIAACPDLFRAAEDAIGILEVAIETWNTLHPDEPDEVLSDLQGRFIALVRDVKGASS